MIPTTLIRVSLVLALIGMAGGIVMGMKQDFLLAPAHAHLNLVGYVTLFLAALYYHAMPSAARSTLAKAQAVIAVLGAVIFPIGIVAVLVNGPAYEVYAIAGALIAFLGMVLLTVVVFIHGLPRAA